MSELRKSTSTREKIILASALLVTSLSLTATGVALPSLEEDKTPDSSSRWANTSSEGQACAVAFDEGRQIFAALDNYYYFGATEESRSQVADAVDSYSPISHAVPEHLTETTSARIVERIDEVAASLDSEMFRGALVQDRDNGLGLENEEAEWEALSNVGIEQDQLFIHCAGEGIFVDENYDIFQDEPMDLTELELVEEPIF